MEPLVSCIIPTYNRSELVCRAIKSVLNQTYKNIEVIVVDDGSEDNTKKVVLSIKDSRIKYIRLHRNFGPAFARNIGIVNAEGEFIAFLDSDDYFLPEKIQKQVELMMSDSSIGVCYTEVYYEFENGNLIFKESPRLKGRVYEKFLSFPPYVHLPTLLVRRDLLSNLRFDEVKKIGEDTKFILELSRNAIFDFIPLPLCIINRRKDIESLVRRGAYNDFFIRNKIELFEEFKSDISKLFGNFKVSWMYNRLAWTAYRYGMKKLAMKLLFKSSFETRSLKDFLKAISVALGLYEKYLIKKYGKEKLEEFLI